ncbi:MaoC/PaaZ C-terminal domain-containing protein [Sedimentitalea sp.]|uniref:MaoC/PaaZ C-terminal domain-containing protein n=1 Tax=Sedimentitalea sp. TaxID=2048915 RepID=UPI00329742BF
MNWPFKEIEDSYTDKDTILYALGLGYGDDPTDKNDLRFVYEDGLIAVPTMPVVLAWPGFWQQDPATGINWKKIVAAGQELTIHSPLPTSGEVIGRMEVTDVFDMGPEKGALLHFRRTIIDKASGEKYASIDGTTILRGDGGFDGPKKPKAPPQPVTSGEPDFSQDVRTLPQSALIYRLSADDNPLHADPDVAQVAGFDRPILHGLCTFGIAARSAINCLCGQDPQRLKHIGLRFSSPVFPGETIRTKMWVHSFGEAAFECSVVERDVLVAKGGNIRFDTEDL